MKNKLLEILSIVNLVFIILICASLHRTYKKQNDLNNTITNDLAIMSSVQFRQAQNLAKLQQRLIKLENK